MTGPTSDSSSLHRSTRELEQVARALEGSFGDLVSIARREGEDGDIARRHRVPTQLLASARAQGLDRRRDLAPALDGWRRQMRAAAATHMLLEATTATVATALGRADIAWLPLKGVDLVTRGVYAGAEERPCGDLDLLIGRADLEPARAALEAAGCVGLAAGPRADRYLREEGYAWQARAPTGPLVELHWRLWGSAPDALADRVVAASRPAPELGPTARRSTCVHAWLVAAVHLWLDPPPRAVGRFLDLARILDAAEASFDVDELVDEACTLGLQLPACLAAGVTATLFPSSATAVSVLSAVRDGLDASLRPIERVLVAARPGAAAADLPTAAVALARLAAGRPTRHGLRAVWRRAWPHAGVVEASGDGGEASGGPSRSWVARRLRYQARLAGQWVERLVAFARLHR